MGFIEVLNYSLLFAVGGLIIYYLLISFLALWGNRDIDHEGIKTRKFAVVLFNHGKEQVLSRSLYSVSGLVYPKNKYDIIVIADSYSDSIVQVAEKMGAKILVPPLGKRDENKKNILSWAFDSILQGDELYDAVVIFDSDGLVSGNYLKVMNYYLEQGSEVIQGGFNNLNRAESWIDKIREVDFLINRFVYPMGRKVMRLGINLRSNGICFSTALLREFPWNIEKQPSITEYGLDLRLNGIEIDFASNAVVFKKIFPTNDEDNNSYFRNRNADSYYLIRKYMSRLLSRTGKKKSFKHVGLLLEFVLPQFSNLMLFVAAMGIIDGILWGLGWISLSALLFWLLLVGGAICSVSLAIIAAGTQQKFLRSVMYIPVTIYIKVQGLSRKFQGEEQTIEASNGKGKFFVVPDENQPVE